MPEPSDDFLMLIVSSPSGRGEDDALQPPAARELPDLRFSVSHTTRSPRPTEVDGRDYHFVDGADFEQMIARRRVRRVGRVHDHLYGTSLHEIEIARARGARGDSSTSTTRARGRSRRAARAPSASSSSRPRSPSSSAASAAAAPRTRPPRCAASTTRGCEIEHYGIFDYVIVNDDIDRAYDELRSIVLAERCRRARHARLCERMLLEGKVTDDVRR